MCNICMQMDSLSLEMEEILKRLNEGYEIDMEKTDPSFSKEILQDRKAYKKFKTTAGYQKGLCLKKELNSTLSVDLEFAYWGKDKPQSISLYKKGELSAYITLGPPECYRQDFSVYVKKGMLNFIKNISLELQEEVLSRRKQIHLCSELTELILDLP